MSLLQQACTHGMVHGVMNPILLITGGGRGIGAALGLLAAERGYAVVLNYRHDAQAAEAVAARIRERGGQALTVAADVSQEAEVERLFATVDQNLGRLSVLVNNAGIVAPSCRVDGMDAARVSRMFAVNVVGSFLCAREAIRRMSRRHGGSGGSIVNVSSAAAKHGSAGEYVDYAASKAAIDTFTLGLAREVAAEDIRVNAVRPGIISTDIHADSGDPARAVRMGPSLPMQRAGEPEEVARAILWLCSAEASYCTGAILDVSGGR
jgi:NAD(P)-dependent dehydrogenase (short-subunit alcohol dehydrogenase family)